MHFFHPVDRMALVEVIAGRRSSPEAVATVHALAVRLGKVPVIVKDGPGFLVNRILASYLDEAACLLSEGVSVDAVDRAMAGFGMAMGPFALLDQIGLDTARDASRILRERIGARAGVPEGSVVDGLVAAGRLGAKGGRGFYRYRARRRLGANPEVRALVGSPPGRELPPETVQERLVLAMVREAVTCLADGVARSARDIDLAMVLGTGFPPFRGGPLRHADALGVPVVADRLTRLADAHGERFRPPALLREMVRGEQRFHPR
jgi:3-hydroxyacyl-CoA dehydrogenase/enoyl-CoA hydratase/3-hydroxybutyryl-CoA epimerase